MKSISIIILIGAAIAAFKFPKPTPARTTNDATVRGLATGPWLNEAYSQLRSNKSATQIDWDSVTNNSALGFATEDGTVLEVTNAYIHIGNAYVIRVTDEEWALLTNTFQKYVVIPPR